MAKNKPIRSMSLAGAAQQVIENKVNDKFASIQDLVHKEKKPMEIVVVHEPKSGRVNAQLSCTISQEDKLILNDLALYACNKEQKVLNTSIIIRSLIRLGNKYKDELIFEV